MKTGELTGRVFEDAIPALMHAISPILLHPERLNTGLNRFSILLKQRRCDDRRRVGIRHFLHTLGERKIFLAIGNPRNTRAIGFTSCRNTALLPPLLKTMRLKLSATLLTARQVRPPLFFLK